MGFLRTIFVLGRIASLPTVWSNCLAGWWLGGGRHADHLPFVLAGATLIYTGGAFLKDVFDVEFDRQHRPHRPIPAGRFSERTVYRAGLLLLTFGALILLWPGHLSGALGLALVSLIVAHNTTHRLIPLAPVIRGSGRLLLYLLGAAVAARGIGGWVIWCGLALAFYTSGAGYLAGSPATATPPGRWPLLLLLAPIGLALVMDTGDYRESGLLLSAVAALWAVRAVRPLLWSSPPDPRRAAAGLTAGVVFVDWLATCPLNLPGTAGSGGRQMSVVFLALFSLTLLLQELERRAQVAGLPSDPPASPLPSREL